MPPFPASASPEPRLHTLSFYPRARDLNSSPQALYQLSHLLSPQDVFLTCSRSPSGKQKEKRVGRGRLGQGTPRGSSEPTDLVFGFTISWNTGSPSTKCGLELLNSRFGERKDKTGRCVVINLEVQFLSSTVCWLIFKDKLQNPCVVARDNEWEWAFSGAHTLAFTKAWAPGHRLGLSKQSVKGKQQAREKEGPLLLPGWRVPLPPAELPGCQNTRKQDGWWFSL